MSDPSSAILPPPGVMPATLSLLETAAEFAALIPAAAKDIDNVLGGESLLTFGASALADVFDLVGPTLRDLAAGKPKAQVRSDLDNAIANIIVQLRFPK